MRLAASDFLTACDANAGYIASRNGSAMVAPMPRNTVRRDRYFIITKLFHSTDCS